MIYTETSIPGIRVSKTGSVLNSNTGSVLKISERGYFWHESKFVNLAKLMLETFKGIKQRSGRIDFIDGNKKNFEPGNLQYRSKFTELSAPQETAIIQIIKFYIGQSTDVKIKDVFRYRLQLKTVLEQRSFFNVYKGSANIKVFRYYVSIKSPGYYELSKHFNISVNDARRTVYYFLHKLIQDCRNEEIIKQ